MSFLTDIQCSTIREQYLISRLRRVTKQAMVLDRQVETVTSNSLLDLALVYPVASFSSFLLFQEDLSSSDGLS
jgi:hypothetical protein